MAHGVEVSARGDQDLTPLHYATIFGRQEVGELLMSREAAVDATDADGRTPLHYAAEQGHKEVCEFLIRKGANVNRKDTIKGQTPLFYAATGK